MNVLQTRDASAPAESRGLERDGVRLLVVQPAGTTDTAFHQLPAHLSAGDLIVVNDSETMPAALDGHRPDGTPVVVHLATGLDDGDWIVEVRPPAPAHGPVTDIAIGERLVLPSGATLTVLDTLPGQRRLHRVRIEAALPVPALLQRWGRPIAYGYVPDRWPLADYQTVFAARPGSAEMPSAARPFTRRTVSDLVARGVLLATVTLHTGVSSPEAHEPPNAERYDVPATAAELVNAVRVRGGRVVAVGTTVTRALETVASPDGTVTAGKGWTELVLGPDRPARTVTGLVTGWHEPDGSHVQLLEAVAGAGLVAGAYEQADRLGCLWHEFGDSCLLLP